MCGTPTATGISISPAPPPSTSSDMACPEISAAMAEQAAEPRVRPHQPVHHAGRRRVRTRTAGVRRRTLSRRRRLLHLRRIGIDRDRAETGAAISGRNRTSHAATRFSAASRVITARPSERYRCRATSAAARCICRWCASSRTSACPIATAATSIAPTAAATAASNMPQNSNAPSKPANGEAAAFIFEPVSGATLGAVVPPPGYLQSIAEICRRHGVLLIADEVMTGMGRTGRNFAVDHWNVAPDILVTAKGLSSGYAPLGAVIASKKVVDAIADGSGAFLHGFTYNAHPISLAAGRAVLRYLQSEKLVEAADSSLRRNGGRTLQTRARKFAQRRMRSAMSAASVCFGPSNSSPTKPASALSPPSQNFAARSPPLPQARTARLSHARQRRRHPRRPPPSGSSSRHHRRTDRLVGDNCQPPSAKQSQRDLAK